MRITSPVAVAQRLEPLAQAQGARVGAVLKTLLNCYALDELAGTVADVARKAKETGLASAHPVETPGCSPTNGNRPDRPLYPHLDGRWRNRGRDQTADMPA